MNVLKKFLKTTWAAYTFTEWKLRCAILNQYKGVSVSPRAVIAKSVKFQLNPIIAWGPPGEIFIDENARIDEGVILTSWGGEISVKKGAGIGPYCILYGEGGITVGENSLIAGQSFIVASNHNFVDVDRLIKDQGTSGVGISIGNDVWIGCGCRILDGVEIGDGCVIGAGSVVTKSIPQYSIAVGVPARIVGKRGSEKELSDSYDIESKTEQLNST